MIVAQHAGRLELVTQTDHARFSGQILELVPELAPHPFRDELIRAAFEHDNGWQEVDSAPSVDDAGRPHDFLSLPTHRRLELWTRGTRRLVRRSPYAGLLVILHALRLLGRSEPGPALDEVLGQLEAERDRLLEEMDLEPEAAQEDYLWLDLVDLLSLAVCNRWSRELERRLPGERTLRARLVGSTLLLDPFPLAGATTFHLSFRMVESHTFPSSVDFAMELASQPWIQRSVTLSPREDIEIQDSG